MQNVAGKFRMRQVNDAVAPEHRQCPMTCMLDTCPCAKNSVELLRHLLLADARCEFPRRSGFYCARVR